MAEKEIVPTRKINTDRFGRGHQFFREPVDIIIPYHGQCAKVTKLISSILTYTSDHPYLITLIDDGSPSIEFAKSINNPKSLDVGARRLEAINGDYTVPFVRVIRTIDLVDEDGPLNENGEKKTTPNQCGFGAALNLGL